MEKGRTQVTPRGGRPAPGIWKSPKRSQGSRRKKTIKASEPIITGREVRQKRECGVLGGSVEEQRKGERLGLWFPDL